MNKGTFVAASLFSFLMYANSSWAALSFPYGWYGEANIGYTKISQISLPGSSDTIGAGGNANIGYKFMPYFGAEVGYTYYAKTDIDDQFNTKAATNRRYSYYIAGRAIFPLADSGVEAFAKVGAQRLNSKISIDNTTAANNIGLTSSDSNTTGLYLGVGAQYYFSPEFALNLQWARSKGNDSTGTADLYSIGASFILN